MEKDQKIRRFPIRVRESLSCGTMTEDRFSLRLHRCHDLSSDLDEIACHACQIGDTIPLCIDPECATADGSCVHPKEPT